MPTPPIEGLRVPVKAGVERGPKLSFSFDGEPIMAFEGETVAAALLAAGKRVLRTTPVTGSGRGVYCGMGVCFDCLVVIDGEPSRRACVTFAREGMRVETQVGFGAAR
jgi:aerobic-type carbon monoxide dehydrogenase small subunit (CoxS/CutS family)